MKNKYWSVLRNILILLIPELAALGAQSPDGKWTTDKAWEWYLDNPWICGFNYIPANSINYTAMWDKTSFSPETIERELALAEETGFNAVRVVLQFIVWEDDPQYFKDVFATFLSICSRHKMKVIPAFFDDCVFGTNIDPSLGKQPEPFEGWYAWAWSPSPGHTMVADSTTWPRLEKYVKDIAGTFRNESSILIWDLFNEPRNTSLPLVQKVFRWAREINPSQPLTICMFGDQDLQKIISANCDIITFHNYSPKEDVEKTILSLKQYNRPIICTEWLNRPLGSTVESVLPLFFKENVGCLHWGLVNGKTQTDLPWGHRPGDGPYNRIWQHDLYTTDLKVYSPYEIELFKSFISKSKGRQLQLVK
jgi:hypothetical protein